MTNNNTYTMDWAKLIRDNTPARLQLPKVLAWAAVYINPIITVYQWLLQYRKAKAYQLLITPQVCYLEKILNDRFDFTSRGIYIADGQYKPSTYLYRRAELKPLYLYRRTETKPHILYTRGESEAYSNDFIVFVPLTLVFDVYEMIGVVKYANNLPGTKFKIQTY